MQTSPAPVEIRTATLVMFYITRISELPYLVTPCYIHYAISMTGAPRNTRKNMVVPPTNLKPNSHSKTSVALTNPY